MADTGQMSKLPQVAAKSAWPCATAAGRACPAATRQFVRGDRRYSAGADGLALGSLFGTFRLARAFDPHPIKAAVNEEHRNHEEDYRQDAAEHGTLLFRQGDRQFHCEQAKKSGEL